MITFYPVLPGTVLSTVIAIPNAANPIVVKWLPANTTVAQPLSYTIPFISIP